MSAGKAKTKVVVRRLPPALTQEGFRQALGTLLDELQHDWFEYYPGKVSAKRVVFSRAYINFVNPEAVPEFKQAFDGHLFVGTKGNQYRCAVEYAPYQKIPVASAKKDSRGGTIIKDPDYIEFLKLLEEGHEALPSASAQLEASERAAASAGETGVKVTPLMEYLMEKYASSPGMKLGSLRRKKKAEERAAAGASASAAAQSEAGKTVMKHPDAAPATHGRNRASNGHAADRGAAAAGTSGPASQQQQQQQQQPHRQGRDGRGKQDAGSAAGAAAAGAAATAALGAGAGGSGVPVSSAPKGPVVLLVKPKPGAGGGGRDGTSLQVGPSEGGKDSLRGVDNGRTGSKQATGGRAGVGAAAGTGVPAAAAAAGPGAGPSKSGKVEPRPQSSRPAPQPAQGQAQSKGQGQQKVSEVGATAAPSHGASAQKGSQAGAARALVPASAKGATGGAEPAAAGAGSGAEAAAAAAAAAAAVLQRAMPTAAGPPPSGGSEGGAAGAEDSGRARRVRAGFQAYVPGALRSGGRLAQQQAGGKDDSG